MTDPDAIIPLPQLATHLRAQGCKRVPSYSSVYRCFLDGRVPVQRRNGRLYVAVADLPQLATILGFELSPGSAT